MGRYDGMIIKKKRNALNGGRAGEGPQKSVQSRVLLVFAIAKSICGGKEIKTTSPPPPLRFEIEMAN